MAADLFVKSPANDLLIGQNLQAADSKSKDFLNGERVARESGIYQSFLMRRDITWNERLPDRSHREVRVQFHGGKLFWRERISASRRARSDERWNHDFEPSEEDWEQLMEEVMRRFQRKSARQEDIDLVKKRIVGKRRGRPSQHYRKEL